MKKQITLACVLFLVCHPLLTSKAFESGDWNIFAVGNLGVGGIMDFDLNIHDHEVRVNDYFENSLGVGVWADYAFSKIFAIGIGGNILWWNTEKMDSQGFNEGILLEIGPSFRLGYDPISKVTLYIRATPGVCILSLSDDFENLISKEIGESLSAAQSFGFNLAVLAGIHTEISEHMGLVFEIGYAYNSTYGVAVANHKKSYYAMDGVRLRINVGISF